jgi:hypothetical protein
VFREKRLRQKFGALRHFMRIQHSPAAGDNYSDMGPALAHKMRQLQPVHRTWHVDIRNKPSDSLVRPENTQGLVGTGRADSGDANGRHLCADEIQYEAFVFDNEQRHEVTVLLAGLLGGDLAAGGFGA